MRFFFKFLFFVMFETTEPAEYVSIRQAAGAGRELGLVEHQLCARNQVIELILTAAGATGSIFSSTETEMEGGSFAGCNRVRILQWIQCWEGAIIDF